MSKIRTYHLVNARNVFVISLIVAFLTLLSVYFWGLGYHNSFYENSIISTIILSISFFLFITIGLFRGIKLRDDVGKVTVKEINWSSFDSIPNISFGDDHNLDFDDGCAGVIVSILIWILFAITLAIVIVLFNAIFEVVLVAFFGMLYWIFFRALRLVFKNSNHCKGNLWKSVKLGLTYTVLYNFWIFGLLLLIKYLK